MNASKIPAVAQLMRKDLAVIAIVRNALSFDHIVILAGIVRDALMRLKWQGIGFMETLTEGFPLLYNEPCRTHWGLT